MRRVLAVVAVVAVACGGSDGGSNGSGDGGGSGGVAGTSVGGSGGLGASGGSGGNLYVCAPGQQVQCACGGAVVGCQVCKQDGGGYEQCVCPDAGSGGAGGDDAGDAGLDHSSRRAAEQGATTEGRWSDVAQLAGELEARRRARAGTVDLAVERVRRGG